MATQASPSTALHPHHLAQGRPQPNGHSQMPPPQGKPGNPHYLMQANEAIWLQLGSASEIMSETEGAIAAYERALSFNPNSVPAMIAISCILRTKDQFPAAVEYLRQILRLEHNNGEVWSSLGHCYLMMDDLQQAYSAYQQALYHLPEIREPKLWYGIGILYDRYGSLEHAEEAFSQVMRMEPKFEKANEIYFRLGIIYKQQQKFMLSLECFKYIVADPPRPLSVEDIWFQIGHVHEQQKDYDAAKSAYMRVLDRDPNHAKVLQQLGWLHHQQSTSFSSQEQAIEYLEKSVASDQTDAQSWYLLGRCYMSQQKYPKAYEAYQQAVYRDGRNPTFWCSIGVLYYQINQYRDALDAYSRAIRLNPNISEVWYDLGTLYESCNNQTNDALDAYTRAADLDPTNVHIKARLALLKGQPTAGMPNQGNAPLPQDVHPQAYQPGALGGPPGPQWAPGPSQAPPPGPAPPALSTPQADWNGRRLADIQTPSQQPQTFNPYDSRDRLGQHVPARQPSPARHEAPRQQYQEPQRPAPPSHRGLSPSPKVQYGVPAQYQLPQGPPQHAQPKAAPNRVPNPNFAGSTGPSHGPPPPGPPHAQQMPPSYGGRPASPAPEIRPIVENSTRSPNGSYSRQGYSHHPTSSAPSISAGAPAPNAALQAAEAAAREREERAPTAPPKRHREWEDDNSSTSSQKKVANEESRARLNDVNSRRPSPENNSNHSKIPTPTRRVSPPDQNRMDIDPQQQRHPPPTDGYHPSEAAHHPHIPPMQHSAAPSPRIGGPSSNDDRPKPPSTPVPAQQAQQQHFEPAARKMEVDENYDDSGDETKVSSAVKSKGNSPRSLVKENGNNSSSNSTNGHAEVQG